MSQRTAVAVLTLLGLWLLAGISRAEVLGPNLVPNGSFEEGTAFPADWRWSTANGCKAEVAWDDKIAHTGKRSVRFHSQSELEPHVYGGLYLTIGNLSPGTRYVIRLWARGEGVGNCWFGGGPGWTTRKGLPQGEYTWTRLELPWTVPQGITTFDLRINIDSVTRALWVDDVSFQAVDTLEGKPRVIAVDPGRALASGLFVLGQMPAEPALDGDLSDWPASAQPVHIPGDAGVVMFDGRKGDEDLSATVRAASDARSLYLGVVVRDDAHCAPSGQVAWTNDSLQVSFDPKHEQTVGGYGPNDSEYSLSLESDGKPHVECWATAKNLGDRSSDIRLAVRRVEGTTTYEAAFPWEAIGVTFGPNGPAFGMNVLVNDNDGAGRRGYIELTEGIGKTKEPSAYVTALQARPGTVTVLTKKPTVYLGDALEVRALVAPTWQAADGLLVRIGVQDADRLVSVTEAPLPAGPVELLEVLGRVPEDALAMTTKAVVVQVADRDGKVLAQGQQTVGVTDLRQQVAARAEEVRKQIAVVDGLAAEAEGRGIATDYERVTITVAEDFVGFALDDATHDRAERASHVLEVLTEELTATGKRLQDYLAGRAKPMLVPRFVTSPVEVREGAFWADTVIPTTGQRERRPVFFTGYGHFATARKYIPKWPKLGVNIIQIEAGPTSTLPREGVVTSDSVKSYIGGALEDGARNNVMVCWLASPHYFPDWALTKWPELKLGGGGFLRFTVDALQARDIIRRHLETSLSVIQDSPALHSVCLSNEPVYTNWKQDPFRQAEWAQYLQDKFGTVEKLNQAWGTSYKSLQDVTLLDTGGLSRETDMTPLRYEMARFNMDEFSGFHRFMADVIHQQNPRIMTHAKVMNVPSGRQNLTWGCDPEQFASATDLNGNDCTYWFAGLGDQYAASWMGQNLYYDLQRSCRRVPVFNSEDHIILDREQRLIPAAHTDCALWQGAIHGRGASTIWVWERTYDRASDFEGSIMHRPENTIAVGRVGLDLMRLAPQVVALQDSPAPVAILYAQTSQIWSDAAHRAMLRAYEALSFCGLRIRFVTEKQAQSGSLAGCRAVILPSAKYAPDALVAACQQYARQGGRLWVLGDAPFGMNEYGKPRDVALTVARQCTMDLSSRELRVELLKALAEDGLTPALTLTDSTGTAPWAVEWRSVPDGGGWLVSVANLWGNRQAVQVQIAGKPAQRIEDLRTGQVMDGSTVSLEPLEATVWRVE
jgi:hypothetical protein